MNPAGGVYPVNRVSEPIAVLLVTFGLVLAGGCISGTGDNAGHGLAGKADRSQTFDTPSNPASVYITYPDFDGGVDAGNVTVTVIVRNFSVGGRSGGQNPAGGGKIAYFMDVVPPTGPGLSVATQSGTFRISEQTWYTWHNVPEGTHTFAVELVNNDDSPLVPPVIDAVDVTAVRRIGV